MRKKLLILVAAVTAVTNLFSQNTFEESIPYKEVNGRIILRVNVGGKEGNFMLDTRGLLALTEESAKERNIEVSNTIRSEYQREGFETVGQGTALGFFLGNNVYERSVPVTIIKNNQLLQSLGADGTIGLGIFTNSVLTINSRNKTIITSAPYRPTFMKLSNRGNGVKEKEGFLAEAELNGKPVKLLVDIYEDNGIRLNTGDNITSKPGLLFANQKIETLTTATNVANGYSVLGKPILNEGVISFDVARNKYYFQPFGQGEDKVVMTKTDATKIEQGKVNAINSADFRNYVYDYKENSTWKTKGDKPVVVDFWATWCGPCMRMMPVMEQLAAKYKDKVVFYKVNVDKEGELRTVFEANAIPLLIFGSLNDGATREVGADSKEKVEARILRMLK